MNIHCVQGSAFYRIVDRFICQSGQNTDSIYGGQFKDDPGGLKLKHDRRVSWRGGEGEGEGGLKLKHDRRVSRRGGEGRGRGGLRPSIWWRQQGCGIDSPLAAATGPRGAGEGGNEPFFILRGHEPFFRCQLPSNLPTAHALLPSLPPHEGGLLSISGSETNLRVRKAFFPAPCPPPSSDAPLPPPSLPTPEHTPGKPSVNDGLRPPFLPPGQD